MDNVQTLVGSSVCGQSHPVRSPRKEVACFTSSQNVFLVTLSSWRGVLDDTSSILFPQAKVEGPDGHPSPGHPCLQGN